MLANGGERGRGVVHRLVAEFPEVTVQVVLVALAQAVYIYRWGHHDADAPAHLGHPLLQVVGNGSLQCLGHAVQLSGLSS